MFYDALLADYAEVPRTIVLSMHPVSEVSALLEEVVVLDNGRFVTQSPVDALRGRGSSTVGPAAAATSSPTVSPCALRSDSVTPGPPRSSATSTPPLLAQATAGGLEIGPVGPEDLFVHLTASTGARS